MGKKTTSSRRDFMKATSSLGFVAAMPTIVPSSVVSAEVAPSDTFVVGNIGLGWRGMDLVNGAMRNKNLEIAAIADLDMPFLLNALKILDDHYVVEREWIEGRGSQMKRPALTKKAVDAYNDYRYLLERKDLDAVMIAVPDHWHAKTYIDAMNAGKDVYGEKPLSLTINQGRAIVRAARTNNRIFQTGSQQRSAKEFRTACEYVRNGRLGKIRHVHIGVGGAPQRQGVPDEPVPPGLNWEMWLGQTPVVPYNPLRCHVEFRWFFEYSGGMVTDWGAHHCDICQWGLGMDGSGPRFVEGTAETSPGFYNTFTSFDFKYTYANGITASMQNKNSGVTFYGEKGEIYVNRGKISSNPEDILKEPLTSNDIRLYKSEDHIQNWVDCMKSRELPITDVEIGHRSITMCHIANICGHLKRKLEWDAENEMFVNDPEANGLLDRPQRAPYAI
ncbi:MAG: gfo/Idh/MocA family oxidoreductase [Candidatus Omnitrophota bacterium]|jgi:predicted dehydrogenase|nr:MAG: gfo/Idh/MocA family oxidoreductase [Candidatus Omnitrophota bacterium]